MSRYVTYAAEQDCGLIIQQDGKPQQVLAKFLSLLLNYQFGLSVLVTQEMGKAATEVALKRNIRCVFAIQSGALGGGERLAGLNRQGAVPLFLILPRQVLERLPEATVLRIFCSPTRTSSMFSPVVSSKATSR